MDRSLLEIQILLQHARTQSRPHTRTDPLLLTLHVQPPVSPHTHLNHCYRSSLHRSHSSDLHLQHLLPLLVLAQADRRELDALRTKAAEKLLWRILYYSTAIIGFDMNE